MGVGPAGEGSPGGQRIAMTLRFVDVLEDTADLEQLPDRDPLARRKMGERRRESDRLGLVEDRPGLGGSPFAARLGRGRRESRDE